MIDDFLAMSVRNLKGKGIRSWLTMVGIFVGIAAIVSLISLGEGLQSAINEQYELLGYNMVYIYPGSLTSTFTGGGGSMNDHDLEVIRKVHGVDKAGGLITKLAQVKYKDEVMYSWVAGMDIESQDIYLDSSGIYVERGQKRLEEDDKYKAVVGYEYWIGNAFDRPVGVGDRIIINDKKFSIVGEMSRIGNPEDDKNIYIPMETAKELFGVKDEYIIAIASVKPNYEVDKTAEDIKKALRRDRGLDEGEENFQVQTMQEMVESVNIVLDAVQAVVIGIALISLMVGGIGIMNTMYTSVLERTREIGVMKAVGAKNSDIMILFLIESGTIGMVGGIVGCIIGAGMALSVEYAAALYSDQVLIKASITPELIVGALAFSFIVGCISGVLPARQASQLKPVDALRYE